MAVVSYDIQRLRGCWLRCREAAVAYCELSLAMGETGMTTNLYFTVYISGRDRAEPGSMRERRVSDWLIDCCLLHD